MLSLISTFPVIEYSCPSTRELIKEGEIAGSLEKLNKQGYFSNYCIVALEEAREDSTLQICLNIQVVIMPKRFETVLRKYLNCVQGKYLVLAKELQTQHQIPLSSRTCDCYLFLKLLSLMHNYQILSYFIPIQPQEQCSQEFPFHSECSLSSTSQVKKRSEIAKLQNDQSFLFLKQEILRLYVSMSNILQMKEVDSIQHLHHHNILHSFFQDN